MNVDQIQNKFDRFLNVVNLSWAAVIILYEFYFEHLSNTLKVNNLKNYVTTLSMIRFVDIQHSQVFQVIKMCI